MLHVERNGCVAQLIDEVRAPVPLQTWWIQGIKQALERWIRQRANQIERWRPEAAAGLEGGLSLLWPAGIAPHNATHRLVVQMFREGRPRRDGQESDEAINIFRRLGDKLTVPLHDLGCLVEWPQHRPTIDGADRVQPKQEGGDDTKVAPTTADAPEQVGILFRTGGDQPSIRQDQIHGKEIVHGET